MYFLQAVDKISPTEAYFLTNFGENPSNFPKISSETKICPSQTLPAPIPIVGIDICYVINFATSAGTISKTTAKAPAASTLLASSKSLRVASKSFP